MRWASHLTYSWDPVSMLLMMPDRLEPMLQYKLRYDGLQLSSRVAVSPSCGVNCAMTACPFAAQ